MRIFFNMQGGAHYTTHYLMPDGTEQLFTFYGGEYDVPDGLGKRLLASFPDNVSEIGESKADPGPAANKAAAKPERNK